MRDNYHRYLQAMKKSDNDTVGGRNKISNYLGMISSVLKGGLRANIKSTINSENKNMKIMSPYGISSAPYKGMQAQVLFNDDDNVIVGIFDKDKPNVLPGEVILYNKSGSMVKIDKDGKIIIDNKLAKVEMDGDNIGITGNIAVTGQFTVNGMTIENIINSMI